MNELEHIRHKVLHHLCKVMPQILLRVRLLKVIFEIIFAVKPFPQQETARACKSNCVTAHE